MLTHPQGLHLRNEARRLSRKGYVTFTASNKQYQPGKEQVICLPGILARPDEQFGPILAELEAQGGRIHTYNYEGRRFNPEALVESAVELVRSYIRQGTPVALLGASMGGMVVPFIMERLNSFEHRYVRVVIVDAPTGAETMAALPNWIAWLFPALRPGVLTNLTIGKLIMRTMMVPPKRDMITFPDTATMSRLTEGACTTQEEYIDWVIETARHGLRGHLFSMWWSQLAWMIRVGRDGTLREACESLVRTSATYVACTRGNDVVCQPQAADWWRSQAHIDVIEVSGTHCGFLQDQPVFARVLGEILE